MMGGPQQHLQAGTAPPPASTPGTMIGSRDDGGPTTMDKTSAIAGASNSDAGGYLIQREYQRRVEEQMRDPSANRAIVEKNELKNVDDAQGLHPRETPELMKRKKEEGYLPWEHRKDI